MVTSDSKGLLVRLIGWLVKRLLAAVGTSWLLGIAVINSWLVGVGFN